MSNHQELEREAALLRSEKLALQQLLQVYETIVEQESKRLEEALALLTEEQRALYARILKDEDYDSLTGLPNRSNFGLAVAAALERSHADEDFHFGIFHISFDCLRRVAESMGQQACDELIKDIASRLSASFRVTDVVSPPYCDSQIARLGDDEFAVILNDISVEADLVEISHRVHKSLLVPFKFEGTELFAAANIGIVRGVRSYSVPEELQRDASIALRQARLSGQGHSQLFDTEMRSSSMLRWELENDLRQALSRQQLSVYYQSKVDLATGLIAGFEALLRWKHPKHGFVSPLQFIPIAEETGLIIPIGSWVLRQACLQTADWNSKLTTPVAISVNLSPCQFQDENLFDEIARTLEETNLAAQQLSLEITESNLMTDPNLSRQVMLNLKELNVGLMIDDFGTGYSSLQSLSQFPFNTLKIDQCFVRAMHQPDGLKFIETILKLAENLRIDVVAEGIETEVQSRQLRALGCQYGQGYLFSRPVTAQDAAKLLFPPPSQECETCAA